MALLCNDISHWLGASLELVLGQQNLSVMPRAACWLICFFCQKHTKCTLTQIARFMRPTWGPPGSCRPQVGPVLEIPKGPPVRGRQLWRRTEKFLLNFLQFYVNDLRFKPWGPTTFLTEFQTLSGPYVGPMNLAIRVLTCDYAQGTIHVVFLSLEKISSWCLLLHGSTRTCMGTSWYLLYIVVSPKNV